MGKYLKKVYYCGKLKYHFKQ